MFIVAYCDLNTTFEMDYTLLNDELVDRSSISFTNDQIFSQLDKSKSGEINKIYKIHNLANNIYFSYILHLYEIQTTFFCEVTVEI